MIMMMEETKGETKEEKRSYCHDKPTRKIKNNKKKKKKKEMTMKADGKAESKDEEKNSKKDEEKNSKEDEQKNSKEDEEKNRVRQRRAYETRTNQK